MTPEELIQLKQLLIDDAVTAIKIQNDVHHKEITAIITVAVAKVDAFDGRITKLERTQGFAIKGAIAYSSAVAVIIGMGLGWLKSKIHIG